MGKPSRATQAKRERERSRAEHQQEKRDKRATKTDTRTDRERLLADGIDPDLVGIIPGPQPLESFEDA